MYFGLIILFFIAAAIYASVGFGGGSTYTALLAISGTPYYTIPVITLICNICVVTSNCLNYANAKLIDWKRASPIVAASVPMAWFGGQLSVSEVVFTGLLSISLLLAGIKLTFFPVKNSIKKNQSSLAVIILFFTGGGVGFLSGIVGIGGGIFLAPILYQLRWANSMQIAAICSLFILINSIAGLLGQLSKFTQIEEVIDVAHYWPLICCVIIGGYIGNRLSLKSLSNQHLQSITGILIFVVAIRLIFRWAGMLG